MPTKNEDICQWYLGLLLRSETLDYSQVHGCHILRPWGMSMWLNLKQFVNSELKNSCKINESLPLEVSFPMLIPEEALGLEAEHVAGFAPEVAWVTQTGSNLDVTEGFLKKSLKANDLCKLKENSSKIQKSNDDFLDGKSKEVGETSDKVLTGTRRLAIRPTSETLFYPAYAQWIKSTRDLPMRLFQWCSVLRWERRHPIPLLRSREFHWIEGHSAFSSREMALDEAKIIVSIFKLTYENLLAVPVVLGEKSTGERFAGSEMSLTLEAAIPRSGRAIQAATAHYLGQRFAKIFGISYHDCTQLPPTQYVWQACWGLTVRALGVTIMMHGDDDGLVLPPKIAPIQVVIVPISSKIHRLKIKQLCDHLYSRIDQAGIRVLLENDDSTSTGSKFNHWELRGVPLMIIVGPDELSDCKFSLNMN